MAHSLAVRPRKVSDICRIGAAVAHGHPNRRGEITRRAPCACLVISPIARCGRLAFQFLEGVPIADQNLARQDLNCAIILKAAQCPLDDIWNRAQARSQFGLSAPTGPVMDVTGRLIQKQPG